MIKTERITIGENQYIKSYSDSGVYIHGGEPESDYSEAIDPADSGRTYTETDIPIESDSETIIEILTGGAE